MNNEELERICNQWLFNPKEGSLEKIYEGLAEIDFSSAVNAFVKRLNDVNYKFTKTEQVSGAICFYGSVFVSLLTTGKIEQIEHLFTFALCYMLVDHFLDDKNNTEEDKKIIMKELYQFIQGQEVDNILISAARTRYCEMIAECPNVQTEIMNLFQAEWEGHKISKRKDLDREVYQDIAWRKGAGTARTIAAIIGIDVEENAGL